MCACRRMQQCPVDSDKAKPSFAKFQRWGARLHEAEAGSCAGTRAQVLRAAHLKVFLTQSDAGEYAPGPGAAAEVRVSAANLLPVLWKGALVSEERCRATAAACADALPLE